MYRLCSLADLLQHNVQFGMTIFPADSTDLLSLKVSPEKYRETVGNNVRDWIKSLQLFAPAPSKGSLDGPFIIQVLNDECLILVEESGLCLPDPQMYVPNGSEIPQNPNLMFRGLCHLSIEPGPLPTGSDFNFLLNYVPMAIDESFRWRKPGQPLETLECLRMDQRLFTSNTSPGPVTQF